MGYNYRSSYETPDDVQDTLEKIKHLNPDSLTVHTLALKKSR